MWKRQSSYRSFHDYELDRVLEQKKNLAQVESVLTMYERNNLDLVQTVEELIRQNKILKRDRRHDSHIREQQNYPNFGIKHSNISIKQSKYIQTQPQSHKSSTKQAAHLPNCNSTYHPRNAYLTPQQIQSLSNRRKYNEAKMAQTSYNHSRQYEQFKQKLSNKKEQLKRSYKSKSNLQTSNYNMSMSRKVYLEQPSLETQQKLPLQENNMCVNNNGSKDQTIKDKGNLNTKNKESLSPYENFKTNSSYNSPFQKHKTRNDNKALVERSSSAIKIEDVYSQNSVRIQQPKTKWKDVSSTYFSKQKRNYNMEKGDKDQQNRQEINENSSFSVRLYKTTTTMVKEDQGGKKSRRKFLKVVSGNPAAAQKSFQ